MSANTPLPAAAPNDAKDKTPDDDSLGYDAYAKTLWARIEQALNRDAHTGKIGDDPLVVGIFGEWGSGKSYLLEQVRGHAITRQRELVDLRKLDEGFGLTIPVLFQPWKYEHEEHLHVPLMLHILEELKAGLKLGQTRWEKYAQAAQAPGDWLVKSMDPITTLFAATITATAAATGVVIPAVATKVALPASGWLARQLAKLKTPKIAVTKQIRHTDDGRYFYDIHQVLKAVTRPAEKKNKELGYLQDVQILNQRVAINFVIFVDDLDRCLPEKAVAVLELIKTIFNVESFAFVLALDEEVIERGVGHRYSAYLLRDKKPQMPITGFEYLEKIVHLPFRLPALTERQAVQFATLIENRVEPKNVEHRWFQELAIAPTSTNYAELASGAPSVDSAVSRLPLDQVAWWRRASIDREAQSPLLRLLLKSFDGYVPRKLLRAVELWHQVCRVSREREEDGGRSTSSSLTWNRSHDGRQVPLDTRVVFTLVLLQLFQPDLFRFMRRRVAAFPMLLGAFADATDGFLTHEVSDIDLWSWASYRAGDGNLTIDAQVGNVNRPRSEAEALVHIANFSGTDAVGKAYRAQRVRIGLAERLVEHFATQRHVFNPLKLLKELADQIKPDAIAKLPLDFHLYFSVLAKIEPVVPLATKGEPLTHDAGGALVGEGAQMSADVTVGSGPAPTIQPLRPIFEVSDIDNLFATIMAADTGARADIQERFSLRPQQVMASESVKPLQEKFLALARQHAPPSGQPWTEPEFNHAIGALAAIAPWLYWDTGGKRLVRALAGEDSALQGLAPSDSGAQRNIDLLLAKAPSPKSRAVVGDMLQRFPGGDPRFDPANYWLPWETGAAVVQGKDQLAGFLMVPSGTFTMGHSSEEGKDPGRRGMQGRNTPHYATVTNAFYIARMLTTVDQYARFVGDSVYVDAAQTLVVSGKSIESNREPRSWSEQRANGNHPVTGLTWFQARGYARWLDSKLRADNVFMGALDGYEVRLPNEVQWERAARATGLGDKDWHEDRWPFGDDDQARVTELANVDSSGINGTSSVGTFAPTKAGLFDIAGNVWEWMDNQFDDPINDDRLRVKLSDELDLLRHDGERKPLSLRGGSWIDLPELACCSFRDWVLPGGSYGDIGVRVVLSLA